MLRFTVYSKIRLYNPINPTIDLTVLARRLKLQFYSCVSDDIPSRDIVSIQTEPKQKRLRHSSNKTPITLRSTRHGLL